MNSLGYVVEIEQKFDIQHCSVRGQWSMDFLHHTILDRGTVARVPNLEGLAEGVYRALSSVVTAFGLERSSSMVRRICDRSQLLEVALQLVRSDCCVAAVCYCIANEYS